MFHRAALGLGVVLVLALSRAPAAELPPASPYPALGIATIDEKGDIEIKVSEIRPMVATAMQNVTVMVDGKPVTKEVPTQVLHLETETCVVGQCAEDYHVFRDGVRLTDAARKELFKKPTPVAFTIWDKVLDPFYAQFFKEGTPMVYIRLRPKKPHPKTWEFLYVAPGGEEKPAAGPGAAPGAAAPGPAAPGTPGPLPTAPKPPR